MPIAQPKLELLCLYKTRNEKLALLYDNKPLMLEASVAFIVIFLSFLNDTEFFVKGITTEGISPDESLSLRTYRTNNPRDRMLARWLGPHAPVGGQ